MHRRSLASMLRLYRLSLSLVLMALLLLPRSAGAAGDAEGKRTPRLEVHADLQNLFHFRNDSDFDRTQPFYDTSGQTVGAFATLFTPRATFHILPTLRIAYEVEFGLNYWSKQNPDQQAAMAADVFVMKHREIYGEGEFLSDRLGFKAGYSHLREPTGLFLAHWIGNAQLWLAWSRQGRVRLFVGEVPDQTYEGINVTENNFRRDIFVFGLLGEIEPRRDLRLAFGLTNLVDTHLVGQQRQVVSPSVRLEAGSGTLSGSLDAVFQGGRLQGRALGGGDQTLLAWATQLQGRLALPKLVVTGTVLLLSPDDAHPGNAREHAFLYSGKSRSATLLFSEDEVRDWYDNLDERMSTFSGGFFQNRAGLLLADIMATWSLHRRVRPSLILGLASALKPANALDSALVGFEADLLVDFPLSEHLLGQVAVSGLFPRGAGAALINDIRLDATDPQVMTEVSLVVRY